MEADFPRHAEPAWMGIRFGRWERDEFVIETRGLNDALRA
jgi:hypothetical protein